MSLILIKSVKQHVLVIGNIVVIEGTDLEMHFDGV